MTREEGIERMKTLARKQPLRTLGESLAIMDGKADLDDAERLTRMVIIDVICERSPEADAAFEAWCESDDMNMRGGSEAIVKAVRAPR